MVIPMDLQRMNMKLPMLYNPSSIPFSLSQYLYSLQLTKSSSSSYLLWQQVTSGNADNPLAWLLRQSRRKTGHSVGSNLEKWLDEWLKLTKTHPKSACWWLTVSDCACTRANCGKQTPLGRQLLLLQFMYHIAIPNWMRTRSILLGQTAWWCSMG